MKTQHTPGPRRVTKRPRRHATKTERLTINGCGDTAIDDALTAISAALGYKKNTYFERLKMDKVNYLGDIKGEFTIFTTAAPKFYSRSGYGSKIPTQYMVRFGGREYRVYAICFSNCASHYISIKGARYYLHDYDVPQMESAIQKARG